MNEIQKLKTEHARYKAALVEITNDRECVVAIRALYPPPPPTVTLSDLQDALQKAVDRTGDYVALLMNKDGSGNFRIGCHERRGKYFSNLHNALAMLLSDTDLSL